LKKIALTVDTQRNIKILDSLRLL